MSKFLSILQVQVCPVKLDLGQEFEGRKKKSLNM